MSVQTPLAPYPLSGLEPPTGPRWLPSRWHPTITNYMSVNWATIGPICRLQADSDPSQHKTCLCCESTRSASRDGTPVCCEAVRKCLLLGRRCSVELCRPNQSVSGEALPLQPCAGPQGTRKVEAPGISKKSEYESDKAVSPKHRPLLPPRMYTWFSFLLEVEATPGPQCGRKD